jgi:methylated-DNA-[protein]-cysteine S-methyltransferase
VPMQLFTCGKVYSRLNKRCPMSKSHYYRYFPSPFGEILLTADGEALTGLYLPGHKSLLQPRQKGHQDEALFRQVCGQLNAYFAGELQTFDVPLYMKGTPFQQLVWHALLKISFGTTISYGELARRIGRPSASRAVGAANGRNPISIIVPCHRVIGANGTLTGYGGGLDRKEQLLRHEAETIRKWR